MNFKKLLPVLILAATFSITGCKEDDSKIQTRVEEKLQANQETAGTSVSVSKGVATLTGQVATDNGRTESEKIAKATKGVKSVVNNLTVSVPVSAAPVVISADEPLMNAVRDATKDHPTVNATVANGTITLTGSISRDNNRILMQKLNGLNPGKIDNQLTVNP